MFSIRLSYCTQGDYMLIGYARISTHEQNHDLQLDTLTQAGGQTISFWKQCKVQIIKH